MNNGGAIDYGIPDPVRDGNAGTGHIAIVKPMPRGENVVHEAVSSGLKDMMTGWSQGNDPYYQSGNPPTSQTIEIKWTVNGDGTYTLTYAYWQDGTQKDITRESKITKSKTYSESEVKAMFGEEGKAWFGAYAGADPKTEKWESIKVGNDALRQLEINYYYPKKVLDMATGQYDTTAEMTRIPETLIPSAKHVGFNGKRLHTIPDLPSVMESYIVPTADTASPLTPLKEPTLYTDGTNYKNPPSFTMFNPETKQAEFYIVPFKKGATAAEREVVHYYNIGLQPKTVDVKIEYVLVEENGPIVADTVNRTVEIGSEVGAEAKTYAGYNLSEAKTKEKDSTIMFDGAKSIVAKKNCRFQCNSCKKSGGNYNRNTRASNHSSIL